MTDPALFRGIGEDAPTTEGVKYAGSKLKLLPYILRLAEKTDARTVFDGFSGTTRVSQAFALGGYRVIANDISAWSEVFATCYLLNRERREAYRELIEHLDGLSPIDGWFTEHYGGMPNGCSDVHGDGLKKPWQIHNTRRLDAIRDEIDRLDLSPIQRAVAITSLILALDRVDSTLGHFVSYLKDWSPRSFRDLRLEIPRVFENTADNLVLREDALKCAGIDADLAYLDPPYGSNNEKMPPSRVRYASYYHLWTTVCLNDKPKLFGKALRRNDSSDTVAASVFEDFRKNASTGRFVAVEAIDDLIRRTKSSWIILSYSSGGRATENELNEVLNNHGSIVDVIEMEYKRNVMSGMRWTNSWIRDSENPNREFLFLLQKS